MDDKAKKQISCKRCQKRKIRCSRTSPCINCRLANVPCEFREDGSRKYPVSRDYVEALENRVAALEGFLTRLKSAPGPDKESMIDSITFLDHHTADFSAGPSQTSDTSNSAEVTAVLQEDKGSLLYHGPTSIYNGDLARKDESKEMPVTLPLPLIHSMDSGEGVVSESLGLFFHWQYSQFMFIDREAFILDYQNQTFNGQYCSTALVNAICSIGALMSPNSNVRNSATAFAETAQGLLMTHGLNVPHTTSVQALLCCAFYEIGLGNLSKGWLYSGMAFRMGEDLGFQRDPKIWSKRRPNEKPVDEEYRRRIYWGCYISDKFFSLFLGRPTALRESDADVVPSEPLPQTNVFDTWAKQRGLDHLRDSPPIVPKLTLVFNQQVELGRIIQDGLSILFSPKMHSKESSMWMEVSLNELDARLSKFRESLPANMRLKEWSSISEPVQPQLAVLHILHHSTRISLTRPFLHRQSSSNQAQTPAKACSHSVERVIVILKRFRAQHGLRHAPLALVYGAIAASNAALSLARLQGSAELFLNNLRDLELAIEEMAPTWGIAGNMLSKLREIVHGPLPGALPTVPVGKSVDPFETSHQRAQAGVSEQNNKQEIDIDSVGFSENQELLVEDSYLWDPMSLIDDDASYWYSLPESGQC